MIIYVAGDIKNQISIMVSPTKEWQKKIAVSVSGLRRVF